MAADRSIQWPFLSTKVIAWSGLENRGPGGSRLEARSASVRHNAAYYCRSTAYDACSEISAESLPVWSKATASGDMMLPHV